jgi:pantoate--beta-alanine ligase
MGRIDPAVPIIKAGDRSGLHEPQQHGEEGEQANAVKRMSVMHLARTPNALAEALSNIRRRSGSLGFVPTMGALHAGHQALLDAARLQCDAVAASIFVNPLQFGPTEDFARYPRNETADLALLRAANCDVVWLPDVATMYPPESATHVVVGGPAEGWEGAVRPGHFWGVATVVARLFGQIRPDRAYFGEKDWQQLQVVRRMTADLALPVEIVPVPTVREADGLALSSRNRYLSPTERALAPLLYRTMQDAAAAIRRGGVVAEVLAQGAERLCTLGFVPDYFALVAATTVQALNAPSPDARLIAAARLGSIRLIDNIPLQ